MIIWLFRVKKEGSRMSVVISARYHQDKLYRSKSGVMEEGGIKWGKLQFSVGLLEV